MRDHDVERPHGRDLCAFKALRIFFGKVMHLAARRLSDLASRLRLSPELARDAYAIVEHVVYEHTSLAYNRHVDQIVLASVYGACKVSSDDGVSPTSTSCASLQFKDIIYQYSKQPHASEEIYWTVTLEQTDPELDVVSRGDIISFYNQVFVRRVKTFLLTLRERREREKSTGARDGDENFVVPPSPRRRLPIANRSIYVSPMRPERVSSVLNHDGVPATPRTKSLFATIGETAYASSNDAFEAIREESREAETASESLDATEMEVTAIVCCLRWRIISRERISHTRTSPRMPPDTMKRLLCEVAIAVTPPEWHSSIVHSVAIGAPPPASAF